jgi:SsrA-binding protein
LPSGEVAASREAAASRTRAGSRTGVATRQTGRKLVASNKRARHEYAILKTYEAGIALVGTEVKSLRLGRASLVDAFAQERDGELLLYGLHIPEYAYGTWTNHQPRRTRKLLLHRTEINKILDRLRESGLTLVPLSMYFEGGWAKVELGLARGKRSYDKRQVMAQRDANRDIARELSRHLKGQPRP